MPTLRVIGWGQGEVGQKHVGSRKNGQGPERATPDIELGEDAAERRAEQSCRTPHARNQCLRPGPEGLGKDDPDHGVGQCKQNAPAKPLHGAADQEHGHGGCNRADDGTRRKDNGCKAISPARAERGEDARAEGRAHDRREDEQAGVPCVVVEAADVRDDGRQDGDRDVDIHRMEGDAAGQCERSQCVSSAQELAPTGGGLVCQWLFPLPRRSPSPASR